MQSSSNNDFLCKIENLVFETRSDRIEHGAWSKEFIKKYKQLFFPARCRLTAAS
jgi:hypothetical protein